VLPRFSRRLQRAAVLVVHQLAPCYCVSSKCFEAWHTVRLYSFSLFPFVL
jgi:hypothetical protein